MSVKFQLKKDAYMKKGAVGFSYTTYFWEFFVPIFRGDGKGLLMLFIARILLLSPGYLIKYFFRNFIFNPNSLLTKILTPLLDIKYKYIVICYYLFLGLLLIITTLIWLYIGNWYNKNYTYLPYTDEEMADTDKIERYLNFAEQARKTERSKAIAFFVILFIFYLILFITAANIISSSLQ